MPISNAWQPVVMWPMQSHMLEAWPILTLTACRLTHVIVCEQRTALRIFGMYLSQDEAWTVDEFFERTISIFVEELDKIEAVSSRQMSPQTPNS